MRLTWKKQPSEKGLAAVGQGPRGVDLRGNGKRLMLVRPLTRGFDKFTIHAWYFYGSGYNSLQENAGGFPSLEEAKIAAKKYYLENKDKAFE